MNYLSNERGAALITVLLVIVLITLFSMTIIFQISSANKQFVKSEAQVQAKNAAEIGVYYIRKQIGNLDLSKESVSSMKSHITEELDIFSSLLPIDINNTLSPTSIAIRLDQVEVDPDKKEILLSYISTGKVLNNSGELLAEKVITEELLFSLAGNGSGVSDIDEDVLKEDFEKLGVSEYDKHDDANLLPQKYKVKSDLTLKTDTNLTFNDSVYFYENSSLTLKNDTVMTVNGTLYLHTNLKDLNIHKHSRVIVKGNAYIDDNKEYDPNGNGFFGTVCIYGKTNYEYAQELGVNEDCEDVSQGIYYRGLDYGSDSNWTINPK